MSRKYGLITGLLIMVVLAAVGAYVVLAEPVNQKDARVTVLELEIAENATRYSFDETPLHEDGIPAYGNEFITQGYLYPKGTLSEGNGVLENGDPEFPDKVLGEWTCRGWQIGDGGHTTKGPWVMTTQTFRLGEAFDNVTIVTDGYESSEMNVPTLRAIIGGTRHYKTAQGEQVQTLLGFNVTQGINARIELRIEG